jgi:SAM-dependent methyltransferase
VASPQSSVEANRPAAPPPRYLDARAEFAFRYLAGEGLEIGGLTRPLPLPLQAKVRQVERMDEGELREEYGSLDFIVADHLLERADDPIGAIGDHLAKLKPGGVLFYAVADKRFEAEDSSDRRNSWTESAFLRLLLDCQERFDDGFEIEATCRDGDEVVVVLRKSGAWPAPAGAGGTIAELSAETAALKNQVARLEVSARELERVKHSSSWRVTEPLRAAKARLNPRS